MIIADITDYERWILGYEGLYTVDIYGNIRSYFNKGWKYKKLYTDKNGYSVVSLYKAGEKAKIGKVARLVVQAFLPDFNSKPQVNHLNKVRTDNNLKNLEMCTAEENIRHSWSFGDRFPLRGEDQKTAVLNDNLVRYIRYMYSKGLSQRDIARRTGVDYRHIFSVVHRKIWRHVNDNI